MNYRPLGNTGVSVSEIGVGCGGLGVGHKAGLEPAVRRAVELGVNLFDTADSYAGGESETTLGRVFADFPRDRLVIATKFGTVIRPDGTAYQDHSAQHMREALEASLRRLRTDHIDIYQVHTPRPACLEDGELWAELDKLVATGKIRCYGMSVDGTQMGVEFLRRTRGQALQMIFSLFHQEARTSLLDAVHARGAGMLAKVPLAGGALTDRFGPDWPAPTDGRRRRWGEENFQLRLRLGRAIRPILCSHGRTLAQGALAWLLTVSPSTVPIPGISSLERLEETVAAAGMRLTPDEMAALDTIEGGLLKTLRMGW